MSVGRDAWRLPIGVPRDTLLCDGTGNSLGRSAFHFAPLIASLSGKDGAFIWHVKHSSMPCRNSLPIVKFPASQRDLDLSIVRASLIERFFCMDSLCSFRFPQSLETFLFQTYHFFAPLYISTSFSTILRINEEAPIIFQSS